MSMGMENSRYELKFMLDMVQHMELERWLQVHTRMRTSYPPRRVNTLYLDDSRLQGVRDNLAGLPDRAKYRIRWYGDGADGIARQLRFEIKTRSGRVGNKYAARMPELEADFLHTPLADLMPAITEVLGSNWPETALPATQLLPMLFVYYDREYFEDASGVRLTIDTNVHYRSVQLTDTLAGLPGTGNDAVIAELKFAGENKDRVSAMLRSLHVVPQRHSKYLTGMAMSGLTNYI